MRRLISLVAAVLVASFLLASPGKAAYDWTFTEGPEGAIVTCIAATSRGALLVGTESGGLYRSTDGGETWISVEFPWPCCNYSVGSLAAGEAAVYAGTWGGGVARSDDDGETWYTTGSIPDESYPIVLGLAVCRYGETVYAGGQFGVARSDDGGASWTLMSDGLPSEWVQTLALRGTVLYARLGDSGVYRFDPESGAWSAWNEGLYSTLGMQSIAATADALLLSTHEGGVYHLDCGDSAWVAMNDGLYDDNVDAVVEVDRTLYAGLMGGGVWRWNPGVWAWEEVNDGLWNGDVRKMGKLGLSPFAGTWGAGVFRLDPSTDTWTAETDGMTGAPIIALLADGEDVYAGTEGGGVSFSSDQGDNWDRSIEGLGNIWVWVLARDAEGVYAGTWNGVFKTTNQGQTWSGSGLQGNGVFSMIASGSALIAGTYGGKVYSSANGGTSWNEVGTGLPNGNVSGLARVGATLYAAVWDNGVYKLPDGQTVWTSISAGLPDLHPRSMAEHAGTLFLGTESKGVYKWNEAAASWDSCGPWDMTVWSLLSVGDRLLAGGWGTLHASADTGGTWSDEHAGLGEWYAVRALAAGSENLFAGLWGSGVWRAPIAISAVDEGTGAGAEASLRALKVNPNPFVSGARISFRLDQRTEVDLAIYDPSGRRVATLASGTLLAGPHERMWNGTSSSGEQAAAGVYFIRLKTDGKTLTTKTVHLR